MDESLTATGLVDRRLLSWASSARLQAAAVAFLAACGAGLAIGQALCLSRILDRAFLHAEGLAQLAPLLGALVAFSLVRAFTAAGGDLLAAGAALRLKSGLREALIGHLIALGPAYVQAQRTGELTATVMEGVEAVDTYLRQYLPQVLTAAIVPLCLLAFVLRVDPLSALVLLLTAPLLPLFMILIGRAAAALTRRQYGTLGRLSAHFLDVLQGLTTLKVLRRSREQAQVIQRVGDAYCAATLRVLRVAFLSGLALELIATLSTAVVAVQVGLRLLYGHLGFQEAMFVLVLAPEFYLPLRNLGTRFHAGAAGAAAADRVFQILAAPRPLSAAASLRPSVLPLAVPPAIRLRQVTYTYGGSRPALQGLDLEIPAAGMTALVGPSGAGKSTVVYLLLRFLEASSGEIEVDGSPLSSVPLEAWRQRTAWVPQSPYLFPLTLAENLRLARPDASEGELRLALAQAELSDLVDRLPQGLDSPIGERGARLSAGEAQRLAIARAFLRRATFVVLDEPSASLDPALEARLQAAAETLMRGRTVLVIAHRLSTVHRADQIVVMRAGKAVERGTHASLWEAGGVYRAMLAPYLEAR